MFPDYFVNDLPDRTDELTTVITVPPTPVNQRVEILVKAPEGPGQRGPRTAGPIARGDGDSRRELA